MRTKENVWYGIDCDLETSLCEYYFVCRQLENGNTEFLYHDFQQQSYHFCTLSDQDINDYYNDLKDEDKHSFLSFIGTDDEDWIKSDNATKIFDLISYFGMYDIFGYTYYMGLTLEEALKHIGV